MPIYFRNAPVREPFIYDSIGNHWLQDATSRPNGYPFYHYLQTESGCGRITIQGKSYLLHEQEGVLIAPSIRHSYLAQTQEWYTCFCTFSGTVEGSISKILNNRPILFTTKEQCRNIRALLQDAIQLFEHPPVNIPVLSVNCYQVLLQFSDVPDGQKLLSDPLYLRYVAPVIEEIETCYSLPLTVAQLSRQVFVTPQYLSRLFQRFLGCSVYEYLMTCRINRAKELLLTAPRMEVQEIAAQTGFSDPSHFIAMFRKNTGRTPLEFRKIK